MYSSANKLFWIKLLHTLVWLFYNIVIAYLFFEVVIVGKIDKWVWISIGLFGAEAIILLMYNMMCPLTIWARQYSSSSKHNFDIFLPEWLAKNNKLIYTIFLGIILIILIYRLISN